MRCFIIIGGHEYYGPTAERDAAVVQKLAERLFDHYGNNARIITAGTNGITDDFCTAWKAAGGRHICWVKMSEGCFLDVLGDMRHVNCAIAVQGGKGTAEKLQKLEQKGVPIVSFWGSGGAAGGKISFEGYTFQKEIHGVLSSNNPDFSSNDIAEEFFDQVRQQSRDSQVRQQSRDSIAFEEIMNQYYFLGIVK